MGEYKADREYKNNVFCDLFSEKSNALSLYNALNHTDYQNTEELEIVTLSDVIFMRQKNDVSIMFQNELTLWEHQSTLNFNMPLRGLIYFTDGMGIYPQRRPPWETAFVLLEEPPLSVRVPPWAIRLVLGLPGLERAVSAAAEEADMPDPAELPEL